MQRPGRRDPLSLLVGRRGGVKYALALALDQTFGYLTEDGSATTKYLEAKLWDTLAEAEAARDAFVEEAVAHWAQNPRGLKNVPSEAFIRSCSPVVEEVPDEMAWRMQPDTW